MKNTFISKPRKLIPLFQTPLDLKKRSLDNIRDGLLFTNLNNEFEKKESPVQELKLLNYLFNNYTKKNNYLTLISSTKDNKLFNFILQNSINEFNSEFIIINEYFDNLNSQNSINSSNLIDSISVRGQKFNREEIKVKINNLLLKGEIIELELENLVLNKKIEIVKIKTQKLEYKYSLIKKNYILNSLSIIKQDILNRSGEINMKSQNVLQIEHTLKDLAKIYFGNPTLEKNIVKDILLIEENQLINKDNTITIKSQQNNSILLNQYIKAMTFFNKKHQGISMLFTPVMSYNFNYWKNNNKIMLSNLYNFLQSTFIAMNCLISKPIFIITNDKVEIQLFYYLLWNNNFKRVLINSKKKQELFRKVTESKNNLINNEEGNENDNYSLINQKHNLSLKKLELLKKKRNNAFYRFIKMNYKILKFKNNSIKILRKNFVFKNSQKFNTICQILSRFFKKPVELNLIRLHYPYNDSNILVNFLAFNIKKIKVRIFLSRLFKYAVIKKPFNIKDSLDEVSNNKKNKVLVVPSFLSGLKIRIAGRLLTQPVIPRRTVNTTFRGSSSKGKINYLETARFTSKNKRGAFSITITSGHNFI